MTAKLELADAGTIPMPMPTSAQTQGNMQKIEQNDNSHAAKEAEPTEERDVTPLEQPEKTEQSEQTAKENAPTAPKEREFCSLDNQCGIV